MESGNANCSIELNCVPLIFADWDGLLFLFEMALFITPVIMLGSKEKVQSLGYLFRAAMLIVLAGSLYRFSTFLIAFHPSAGCQYFPAATELLITVGLVSAEIMVYICLVKTFPILAGTPRNKGRRKR